MKQSRFADEQIIGFLKQAEAGMSVKELSRSGGMEPLAVAKGLCTGLQIRVGRFDFGSRLHHFSFGINKKAPLRGFLFCV